ncbi:hypothetical protein CHUAL_011063 [Chamberlinius hualienensis]
MADSREPPPLFDDEVNHIDEEDNDDLFVSVTQDDHETISPNRSTAEKSADLLAGGGDEICLDDDDDDTPSDELFKSSFPETIDSKIKTSVSSPPATTVVESETLPTSSSVSKAKSVLTEEEFEEDKDHFLEISVTDPQKIGDGMSAYMAYKVSTRTNLSYFKHKQFSTMRRFSDFLGLHDKLAEKHTHLGRLVPPAPEKSVVGMTKIKISKESDQGGSEFIEKRRYALQRFLRRCAIHPVLRVDPDFREFLECEGELPRATSTSALSSAGVLRLFNRMGDTVSKIAYKMEESDPWFEEKQQQIETLDQQMRKLHNNVEVLAACRKELAVSTSAFAKSAAMLSNCEEHTSLSRALSQLAEVEDRADQIHQEQANQDFYIFAELLKDYVTLIGAVKDIFHQRVKVYQTWQHALQTLNKKREQKAKLELMGKSDKLGIAREEVIEWEAKVERGQEEFENISKMIRKEMEAFEYNRVQDFKRTIIRYMESLMNTQQQLIKCWEAFLPEAKAIA